MQHAVVHAAAGQQLDGLVARVLEARRLALVVAAPAVQAVDDLRAVVLPAAGHREVERPQVAHGQRGLRLLVRAPAAHLPARVQRARVHLSARHHDDHEVQELDRVCGRVVVGSM